MTKDSDTSANILTAARRAMEVEQPAKARDLLVPMVAAKPDMAEAWLQLARAEAALANVDAARAAFERCLDLVPTEPIIWMEFALFEATQGRGGKLVARARKAKLPSVLLAMVQAAAGGLGARAQGRGAATKADLAAMSKASAMRNLRAVEAKAIPLLKSRPGAVVWGLLAQARMDAGHLPKAAEAFRQGLKLEPYAADLRLGLVRSLSDQADLMGALGEARRAAQVAPLHITAQMVYGRMALHSGLTDRALELAERLLARHPTSDAALHLACEAALMTSQPQEALRHARALSAKAAGRDLLIARALTDLGKFEDARAAYGTVLAEDPQNSSALAARGQLYQTLGDTAAAEADLRAALKADPADGNAARALAYGVKLSVDDPAVATMRAALDRPDISPQNRRLTDYALARVLQKSDPKAAAAHLEQANASMLRSYPYDRRSHWQRLEQMRETEWPALKTARDAGRVSRSTAAPIFVTGLPRSGTTLVEAILSAHPDVVAGGELAVLRRSISDLTAKLVKGETVTDDDLTAAGDAYADQARTAAAVAMQGAHLSDKSIFSLMDIGVIRTILPNARIVVVTRDPRDNGLSIWRNQFREGTHRYAATQTGIADQIELFRDTLAFWEAEMPGAAHRISYEALLDDTEGEARAMLDAIGLDWNPQVLAHHEHAGRVKTLSFAQVRQPIYRSSKGGWHDSAEEIALLIKALEARGLLPD